ncbi:MAG: M14 family metallopeptidase [Blastocatellia bacterium]|nr:M14 family metallopeptidase [Blastocatellia bacterium]
MRRAVGALFFMLGMAAVSAMAQSRRAIPTPESALGHRVGADFKLANYDDAMRYLRALEKASDHVRIVEVGRTSEGRAWHMVLISAPANLAKIERYREISQRLAHPEGLTDDEARRLAREGKPFVHIDGGLHSTEVAGGQHAIQLAHDLVAGANDPRIRAILENVVLQLWPSLNPDGQNMVVDWYRGNVGTKFEVAPLPRLYQKYVGHDNNRDAYMLNMIESRVVERVWRHWEPQITYVQHQSSPFPTRIWLPPFAEPIATQVSPLMSRTVNAIGMLIATALEERGQVGATHMGSGFDAWYPGYIDYMPMLQNRAAFWTETALYRYATPHFYTLADFPRDKAALRSESLYSSPWKGGWWRLRDAVDYMLTASIAVLDYAAKYRENVLYNRYQAGRDAIRKYANEPPYAYLVPQEQRDPAAPVELLRRLAFNGVRVAQLATAATIEGVAWPAGTWVIPMNQEYAELARQVLDEQRYPDLREYPEGPPDQPYDAAGWTLPFQMDVRVIKVMTPPSAELRAAWKPVKGTVLDWRVADGKAEPEAAPFLSAPGIGFDTDPVAAGIVPLPGRRPAGPTLSLDPAENNTFRALNLAWQAGGAVQFAAGNSGEPRYVISGVPESTQAKWVESLALRAHAPVAAGTPVAAPRIGVYHPWSPSMDEGWSQWVLEQYKFRFTELTNDVVREGALRARFDVILIADERTRTIQEGFADGTVPPRFVGGVGEPGVRALDAFVREGGTLVCLNRSSDFAIGALRLPVKNVVSNLSRRDFFMGGSILAVEVDAAHPVMAGMPANARIFCDSGPVFAPTDGFDGVVLARYPRVGTPLLSGYLLGEKSLQGQAAALDVRHGNGHVLLLGFRPQWRGQSFGTFRILFNAMLYHGEVANKIGPKNIGTEGLNHGEHGEHGASMIIDPRVPRVPRG